MSDVLAMSRVLIVDDDIDFADSTADVLISHGYQVSTAYSASSAMQSMELFDPHVALIDLRLGVDNGTELIERLRAQRPALVCILMTAYAALDTAIQALRNRADDYLRKPLQPQGMLEVIRTALQRAREAGLAERRERLASVGSLAAGVAHDLNNMLTIVISEAELIERQSPSEPIRAGLRVIHESAVRASQITRNLLLIARGAPTSNPCTTPNTVLRELAAAVDRSLPAGVTLSRELSEQEIPLAIGSSQLYQVVLNLLVNARDAIEARGTVLLRSRISPPPAALAHAGGAAPERQQGLLISVTDDGAGIDAQSMPRLFEPFYTTKPAGTGLGLPTSYGLVRACGGEMLVESKPGVGSEFAVWIPRYLPAPGARGEVSEQPRSARDRTEPLRRDTPAVSERRGPVLLCDDDPMLLHALSRVLRDLGYEVTQARDLPDALRRWDEGPERYGVVISHLRLGRDRGIDLARKVLDERPDVNVILMSGDVSSADCRDPLWEQVTHLQKPFNRASLCAAMSGTRPNHSR